MTVSAPAMERSLPMLHGWEFTPEGAVVHRASQTGVIADLHLGYEWARGRSRRLRLSPTHLQKHWPGFRSCWLDRRSRN